MVRYRASWAVGADTAKIPDKPGVLSEESGHTNEWLARDLPRGQVARSSFHFPHVVPQRSETNSDKIVGDIPYWRVYFSMIAIYLAISQDFIWMDVLGLPRKMWLCGTLPIARSI